MNPEVLERLTLRVLSDDDMTALDDYFDGDSVAAERAMHDAIGRSAACTTVFVARLVDLLQTRIAAGTVSQLFCEFDQLYWPAVASLVAAVLQRTRSRVVDAELVLRAVREVGND